MNSFLSVGVVVPTHNPGDIWPQWLTAMGMQQVLLPTQLQGLVVDSCSIDGTDFARLPKDFSWMRIAAADFNHGSTRNLALTQLRADIDVVVYMTQDALLADSQAISSLVAVFSDPAVACAYGRQMPHANATPLAAHARIFNYPSQSRVVCLADKARLGLKACFMSNSFAAYRVADLLAIGGFPSDVILGEDMSVTARMLMAGKSAAYVAEACVYHSHNYSLGQEFCRYFDTGVFHARNTWLLQEFGSANGEGLRFVRSEISYLWKYAPHLIPSAIFRTLAKWLGYRLGRSEAFLPLKIKRMCSMHIGYWHQQATKE